VKLTLEITESGELTTPEIEAVLLTRAIGRSRRNLDRARKHVEAMHRKLARQERELARQIEWQTTDGAGRRQHLLREADK